MANRTTRTPERDGRFLEALANGATISSAVRSAGYARTTVYKWRAADVELAAAWDDALEAGTDLLEDEALRRAKDGYDEPPLLRGRSLRPRAQVQRHVGHLSFEGAPAREVQRQGDGHASGGGRRAHY
jgi:hypothetical protein